MTTMPGDGRRGWRQAVVRARWLRGAVSRRLRPYFFARWYVVHAAPQRWAWLLPKWRYYAWAWRTGRSPCPLFDSAWYLEVHPDVATADAEPLTHYVNHGWREGRPPHPLFDGEWYRARYQDVAASGVEPLRHYLEHGWREGRWPHPAFDAERYLREYPDVAAAGLDPLRHYLMHGWREGRRPHALFDPAYYRQQLPTASSSEEPYGHFLTAGWRQRRNPSVLFDLGQYARCFPDHDWASTNPFIHFVEGLVAAGSLADADWSALAAPFKSAADGPAGPQRPTSEPAAEADEPAGARRPTGGRAPAGAAAPDVEPVADATGAVNLSALFDAVWYRAQYPDVAAAAMDPLTHYVHNGGRELRQPHPLFDAAWYYQRNPDVAAADMNPLLHYLTHGWHEGRQPHPAFDGERYRRLNPDVAAAGLEPLTHYLTEGWREGRRPHALFDPVWYVDTNPDVGATGEEPYTHFLIHGWRQGRCPSRMLDPRRYAAARLDEDWGQTNPFLHLVAAPAARACETDADWVALAAPYRVAARAVRGGHTRLIAMYLPQYHRVPENDAWWGDGFTEWTNVRRGEPMFVGHCQPQKPHPDVGYYDLADAGVLARQADMARRYGIHGFCFYHYWFNGRRLLDAPVNRMLQSGEPDFPFCLCWANENWTRTWDGLEQEILVEQIHRPENDARFIRELIPALADRRYIRVEGRPLLLVYRPALLEDPAATLHTWRAVAAAEGLPGLHVAAVHSFDTADPGRVGFDAAVQFPPLLIPAPEYRADPPLDVRDDFHGHLLDYREAIRHSLTRPWPHYTLYRGVMPGWDNTARRMTQATVWVGASAAAYGAWLRAAVYVTERTLPAERRWVFINAWNEWAEGAHLEPDQDQGYSHLEATANALRTATGKVTAAVPGGTGPTVSAAWKEQIRILVISHDAALAGAQMVTLRTLRQWKRLGLAHVRVVCVAGGPLRRAFARLYPTTVLTDQARLEDRRRTVLAAAQWGDNRASVVYSSTVVNGPILAWLAPLRLPVVTHAHELQDAIDRWAPDRIMAATLAHTDAFIAAAPGIAANLVARHGVDPGCVSVIAAHVECDRRGAEPPDADALRRDCGAADGDVIVIGCGSTDWRKGADLFCQIAARALQAQPRLRFLWLGGQADFGSHQPDWPTIQARTRFLGTRENASEYFAMGDIFLLPSRSDPMPLVALEAARSGLPIVCFAGAGDIPQALGPDATRTVALADVAAAADELVALANQPAARQHSGRRGRQRVHEGHASETAATTTLLTLAACAGAPLQKAVVAAARPLVSVVVPNYNHQRFLAQRLDSIRAQGVADLEIILLDDASSDGSQALLDAFCRDEPRARLIRSPRNSGSTFRQWVRGIRQARGQFIWIAESDDAAEPSLLETLLEAMGDADDIALAYCQSRMIDACGRNLGQPLAWTADVSPERWLAPYRTDGRRELAEALVHKNTIPNVSAVLLRAQSELAQLVDTDMRLCGDWMLYTRLCGRGGVAFVPEPLNLWRQGTSTARSAPAGELEWREGQQVVREAAGLLELGAAEVDACLARFRQRCDAWSRASAPRPTGDPAASTREEG